MFELLIPNWYDLPSFWVRVDVASKVCNFLIWVSSSVSNNSYPSKARLWIDCRSFQPRIFHPQISTQDSLTMNYFSTINIFSMNLELKSPWLKPKLYIPSTTKTILMLWYKNWVSDASAYFDTTKYTLRPKFTVFSILC